MKLFDKYWWIIVLIALAGLAGWFFGKYSNDKVSHDPSSFIRDTSSGYTFISPLLAVGDLDSLQGFSDLKEKISQRIGTRRDKGDLKTASVYVRDLQTGRWMIINGEEMYAPASMFKLVYLIAILKLSDSNPSILTTGITYKGEPTYSQDQAEPGKPQLEEGKAYAIGELARRMIVYSDNTSADLFAKILTEEQKQQLFADLGFSALDFTNNGDTFTVGKYSLFLRLLYNSTYLSRASSNVALSLLTQADYDMGLVAGVPKGTAVAHKYGHRVLSIKGQNEQQLHDCGIIYKPNKPYLLCVMTKGTDELKLAQTIAEISGLVYNYFGDSN